MSIHQISRQQPDSTEPPANTRRAAHELAINPLWMVTFAAGLLFGMLAVLLTSG